MRIADIVTQLRRVLPGKTDLFNEILSVSSITATATEATITTSEPHGLVVGSPVTLSGIGSRAAIDAVAKDGLLTEFGTSIDHDLTEGNPDTVNVTLEGFTDAAWNTAHELVRVPNRRSFIVRNVLPLPVLNGSEALLEPNRVDGINGLYVVTAATDNSFTIDGSFIAGAYTTNTGRVSKEPRISGAISAERARKIYDPTPRGFWLVVVPDAAVVSKDRTSESDAISTKMDGEDMRLRLLDNFGVMVFAPADEELAALETLDICRHDLLGPIVSSLYGTRPLSGLACAVSEFRIALVGHRPFDYDGGVLVYEYAFQAPVDLTSDDAVVLEADRAYRDTDYAQTGLHTPPTVRVNLDEEPLP